jgi:hypothetical protein
MPENSKKLRNHSSIKCDIIADRGAIECSIHYQTLGPIDTIFTGTGILAILGGLFAMVSLRSVRLAKESEEPPEPRQAAAAGE